jgi:hypothetical protein
VFNVVLLAPFEVYPLVGTLASAWFKALGTSKYLHRRVSDILSLMHT